MRSTAATSSRASASRLTRWRCCRPATRCAWRRKTPARIMLIGGRAARRAALHLVELRVLEARDHQAAAAEWSAHQTPRIEGETDWVPCRAPPAVEGLTASSAGRARPARTNAVIQSTKTRSLRGGGEFAGRGRAWEVARLPCGEDRLELAGRGLLHHEGRHLRDAQFRRAPRRDARGFQLMATAWRASISMRLPWRSKTSGTTRPVRAETGRRSRGRFADRMDASAYRGV